MIGSIIGDMVGSRFEFNNIDSKEFILFEDSSTFTDDTVLTVATADVILHGGSFVEAYQNSYNRYPNRGWGGMFRARASKGELGPYNSFGNGSAMRASPCGWVDGGLALALDFAEKSADATHNHPEGVKGAKAVALAVFLARHNSSKKDIINAVAKLGYNLDRSLSEYPRVFDETCQGTIPLCMTMFNESENFEDAIRTAIAHGGDCDTTACIVGGIAEAFYGKPSEKIIQKALSRLPDEMKEIVLEFSEKQCYGDRNGNNKI